MHEGVGHTLGGLTDEVSCSYDLLKMRRSDRDLLDLQYIVYFF